METSGKEMLYIKKKSWKAAEEKGEAVRMGHCIMRPWKQDGNKITYPQYQKGRRKMNP